VYVKLPFLDIPTPIKQLKGFKRVTVKQGLTERVEVEIDKAQLLYWDESQSNFVTPKGSYTITVGASSEDIRLSRNVDL